MAKQDFIKFYNEYLPQNPSLKSQVDSITNEEQFAKAVLDLGAKAGFSFAQADVEEVMKASEQAVINSELSDAQLDAVAGGALGTTNFNTVQISSLSTTNLLSRNLNLNKGDLAGSTVMCCW